MDEIKLDKFAISDSRDAMFDLYITCTIDTPKGKVYKSYHATKYFFNLVGLDYFLKKTIKEYQDATKESR